MKKPVATPHVLTQYMWHDRSNLTINYQKDQIECEVLYGGYDVWNTEAGGSIN